MTISFPVLVSFICSIASFWLAIKLRHFKVPEKAPVSQAKLSIEERQRKITIGRRLLFVGNIVMQAAAFLLTWLEPRS
jgi:hypothetical protein